MRQARCPVEAFCLLTRFLVRGSKRLRSLAFLILLLIGLDLPQDATAYASRTLAQTNLARHLSRAELESAVTNGSTEVSTGQSGWSSQPHPYPVGSRPYAISCPAVDICYVVGWEILATKDGGGTWITQDAGLYVNDHTAALVSISCPSVNVCYTLSANGTILSTSDGGAHWNAQVLPNAIYDNSLSVITCPHISICYAVHGQKLSATRDGGQSWLNVALPLNLVSFRAWDWVISLSCPTSSTCHLGPYVTTDGGRIWRTTRLQDSTNSFGCPTVHDSTCVASAPNPFTYPVEVTCPTEIECYGTFNADSIVSSTNGGQTWKNYTIWGYQFDINGEITAPELQGCSAPSPISCPYEPREPYCPSARTCYAVVVSRVDRSNADPRTIKAVDGWNVVGTTDGGQHWNVIVRDTGYQFLAYDAGISCPSAIACYGITDKAFVALRDNTLAAATAVPTNTPPNLTPVPPITTPVTSPVALPPPAHAGCIANTFSGVAVTVSPCQGSVGDLVTVTIPPTSADQEHDCNYFNTLGTDVPYTCNQGLSSTFRILPGSGSFVRQASLWVQQGDGTVNQASPTYTAATDFYCVNGTQFYMLPGTTTTLPPLSLPGGSLWGAVQPVSSPCPSPPPAPTPAPVGPVHLHPGCQSPDIQVHPVTRSIQVGASFPATFSDTIATFCDNDPNSNSSDYAVEVIWAASFSQGDEVHPGAGLYGPNFQSDFDQTAHVEPNPEWPQKSHDRWIVNSTFKIWTSGHIRVQVMVHKLNHGGGYSARASTIYITSSPNVADQQAMRNAVDQYQYGNSDINTDVDTKTLGLGIYNNLINHQNEPGLTTYFYNEIMRPTKWNLCAGCGFPTGRDNFPTGLDNFLEGLPHNPDNNLHSSGIPLVRGIVSALADGHLNPAACGLIADAIVDEYFSVHDVAPLLAKPLSDYIASNSSAASALLMCIPSGLLSDYITNAGSHARLSYLWPIAATAFLDHLDDYGNCSLLAPSQACLAIMTREPQGDVGGLPALRTRLMQIAALASQTLASTTDSVGPATGTVLAGFATATPPNFLSRGIALWVQAHVPHPIVCSPSRDLQFTICGDTEVKSADLWLNGTGRILGALSGGNLMVVRATNDANAKTAQSETIAMNIGIGVGLWLLGLAIPPLLGLLPEALAVSDTLVSQAYAVVTAVGAPFIPAIGSTTISPQGGLVPTFLAEFVALLLYTHSVYDTTHPGHVIPPGFGPQLNAQISDILATLKPTYGPDGIVPYSVACSSPSRFLLVNEQLDPVPYPEGDLCRTVLDPVVKQIRDELSGYQAQH